MNAADRNYMAGFNAALDIAESAGVRIQQGTWGHPVRREHVAAGLFHFADAARQSLADEYDAAQERGEIRTQADNAFSKAEKASAGDIGLTPKQVHEARNIPDAVVFASAPKPDRSAARAQGYTGDCCTTCGGFTMRRSGSCLSCETCGSTTGCS